MTVPSLIITPSSIIEFEITQLEPIFTFFPIDTFFLIVVFSPTLKFFPIFTELSIKVLFFKNFLYFIFGLKS